jgi:hypothetical protein
VAAYPSLTQLLNSTEEWVDDIVLDRAVNGTVKARAFFAAKKRRFVLQHDLSSTDRATLQTFYNTNRLLAVTLTWAADAQSYTCLFEGPPKINGYLGAGYASVTVVLAEQ